MIQEKNSQLEMQPRISPRSTPFVFLPFLVTAFILLGLFSLPVQAAPPAASLQRFVDAGRLPPGIMKQINATGSSEIIVVLHVDDITELARTKRNQHGLKFNNKTILDEIALRYNERKKNVLARLAKADYVDGKKLDHLPFIHLQVNRKALEALLNMDEVKSIDENKGLEPHLIESLELIKANQAHSDGFTGLGTAVAVLDTGVDYTLAAFGSCSAPGVPSTCKVAYAQDFAPNDSQTDDSFRHGTNVSGIVVGVAPSTKILGLDVFRADGYAYYSDILAAIDWVIANRDTYTIVSVNMSLGGGSFTATCPGDTLAIAIANLKAAGITSAVSSGNDKYLNALSSPACAPDALSVGAVYDKNVGSIGYSSCTDTTTAADKVTCFSNTASFLTRLAPGSLITSAGIMMAGTSQAAPHVAGAVAILKGAESSLTVDEVINRMTATGTLVTDHRNNITTPRLDAYALLDLTRPVIGLDPLSVTFQEQENGPLPPAQTLAITNDGVGIMNWSVATDAGWLDISPVTGIDSGTVTLSINTSTLAPGVYNGTITVTSPEAINSPQSVPVSLTVHSELYAEDFESGDLLHLPWVSSGNGVWNVQSSTVYSGAYAAQSPAMPDSSESYLEVTLNVTEAGYARFMLKTSTQPQYDKLRFWIDGTSAGLWSGWSGETGWTEWVTQFEITPGIHTFTWGYSKDASVSAGSDAVWIDTIVFPPFNLEIPAIAIDPGSYSFSDTAVGGASIPQRFLVTNTGTGDLVIGTVSLNGTDAGQFAVQSDTCSAKTILALESCSVYVLFQPTAAGTKSAALNVPSNAPGTPVVSASLSGTALTPYQLTVVTAGSGSVSSAPVGINCGVDCTEQYLNGTTVTLTATPGLSSFFNGWSGACSGTGDCVLTMNAAKNVTASFAILPPVANFSASVVTGSAPLIVVFSDTSMNAPTAWLWDFGDGTTSTQQNPTHVYEQEGTYTVSLTATNTSGSDVMITTNYISAGICANLPVKVAGTYYANIQAAYSDSRLNGDIIEVQAGSLTEGLVLDQDVSFTLVGGKNCEYTAAASASTVNGVMTISAGTVVVENLVIQ
jgi:PKD repeat protein